MVVLAYTPEYTIITGQIQKNLASLPKLQNGYYYNPIADINANIASVGGSLFSMYWIDWDATVITTISAQNAPRLQSPVKSSYLGILAVLSEGAVASQHYINFQSQRFPFYGFWNQIPAVNYPASPSGTVVGAVSQILPATTAGSQPGDSICIYPQYIDPADVDLFFNFRATLSSTVAEIYLTDYPPQFFF
jgi:hypothetical protein